MIKPNFIIAVGGSMVPDMEKIEQLKQSVIESNNILPYINLNEKNEYKGWVTDFHIQFIDGSKMELNLIKEEDLFCYLFWQLRGQDLADGKMLHILLHI